MVTCDVNYREKGRARRLVLGVWYTAKKKIPIYDINMKSSALSEINALEMV
jgi:hypothetical protein